MTRFRYDHLVQKSLINVVREVLEDVSKNGVTDGHHFYVRFRTDHPGTKVPKFLFDQHPEEVMIVLEHQFWNLRTTDRYFQVDLSFNGMQETLTIPYDSLIAFVDPSVKFALQFTPSFESPSSPAKDNANKTTEKSKENKDENVISFDSFKK